MNLQQRSALLKARFQRLSAPKVSTAVLTPARGLVRSKAPASPAPRKGVTKPTPGNWNFTHFDRNPELSTELRHPKWLETSGLPPKAALALKRRVGVSPLVRIAEHFPKKTARVSQFACAV